MILSVYAFQQKTSKKDPDHLGDSEYSHHHQHDLIVFSDISNKLETRCRRTF